MDGSLHVGFVRLPMTEPLSSIFIKHEKLILVVPSAKTWQQKSERDILMSSTILQINPDQSPCLAEQTRQYLLQSDITAEPASVTDDIHALLALIAGGNGVALLPESVRNFLPAGVSLHNLEGNQAGWDIGLVWNSQISNHLRDQFIEKVKNSIKSNNYTLTVYLRSVFPPRKSLLSKWQLVLPRDRLYSVRHSYREGFYGTLSYL